MARKRTLPESPALHVTSSFPSVGRISIKQTGSVCGRRGDFQSAGFLPGASLAPGHGRDQWTVMLPGGRQAGQTKRTILFRQLWVWEEAQRLQVSVSGHRINSPVKDFFFSSFNKFYFMASFSNWYNSNQDLPLKCTLPFDVLTFFSPSHFSQKAL